MATIENNVLLQRKNEGGNNEIIYPITKKSNVEGIKDPKTYFIDIPVAWLNLEQVTLENCGTDNIEYFNYLQEMCNTMVSFYNTMKIEYEPYPFIIFYKNNDCGSYTPVYPEFRWNRRLQCVVQIEFNITALNSINSDVGTSVQWSCDIPHIYMPYKQGKLLIDLNEDGSILYISPFKENSSKSVTQIPVLPLNPVNTNSYVPTLDAQPADKKYVDTCISNVNNVAIREYYIPPVCCSISNAGTGYKAGDVFTVSDITMDGASNVISGVKLLVLQVDEQGAITNIRTLLPNGENSFCTEYLYGASGSVVSSTSTTGTGFQCEVSIGLESLTIAKRGMSKVLLKNIEIINGGTGYKIDDLIAFQTSKSMAWNPDGTDTNTIYSTEGVFRVIEVDSNGAVTKLNTRVDSTNVFETIINPSGTPTTVKDTTLVTTGTGTGLILKVTPNYNSLYKEINNKVDESIMDSLVGGNIRTCWGLPTLDENGYILPQYFSDVINNMITDTGWVHLDLNSDTKITDMFEERDMVPVQIRKIGSTVMLNGQLTTKQIINSGTTTFNVLQIPEQFRPKIGYEHKQESSFLKAGDTSVLEVPCHIYLSKSGEMFNIQVYQKVEAGSTVHIDSIWFI